LPAWANRGAYLFVSVDSRSSQYESNETNNIAVFPVNYQLPDLIPSRMGAISGKGANVQIICSITNAGLA
jgi:subtilase family serine protease